MRLARLLLLVAALVAGAPGGGVAQTSTESQSTTMLLEQWEAEAALIEKMLEESSPDSGDIDTMRATIEEQRQTIRKLIEPIEIESNPVRQQLEALGQPPEDPKTEAEVGEGFTNLGSTNAFSLTLRGRKVTAVGEVPRQTVRTIASSLVAE